MQIDQEKIEKAIVEDAVQAFSTDEDLYKRIRDGINARIDKVFADKVNLVVTEAVERITGEGFERTYRKTDSFGRPVGELTSISKELEGLVSNYWTQRVDRGGKPTTDSYNATTRAEWMMVQVCADDFSKEMKQHVVNVAGSLKDHFRAVLHSHIGAMLTDVFKVQSQGDRDAGKPGASSIQPAAGPIGS